MYISWPIFRPLVVLMLALTILLPGTNAFQGSGAFAQTNDTNQPAGGATPGGVNNGSSSDAELWRQIRKGQSGTVVGGDKSSGLMIQSAGQDWRLIRNGPLPKYSAWAILGTLLLLSLFFAVRGRVRISQGKSGQTMKRFSLIERAGHWLLASSFILLALTGLNLVFGRNLLIPVLGKDIFASITVFGKFIHNYVAFAFMLGLVMIAVMWVAHNIPNRHDLVWMLRAGGAIGSGHPPARKFNAGQKIIFWIVIVCGISISISGWALMNPFTIEMFSGTFSLANSILGTNLGTDLAPVQEQQYQSLWHSIMAVFMVLVIMAHIYIGTVGMEGALDAMTTGDVDTNWAREHHSLWVDEVEEKTGVSYGHHAASLATAGVAASATTAAAAIRTPAVAEPAYVPRVESSGTLAPLPSAGSYKNTVPAAPKVAVETVPDGAVDNPVPKAARSQPVPNKQVIATPVTPKAKAPAAAVKTANTPKANEAKKTVAKRDAKPHSSRKSASGSATKARAEPKKRVKDDLKLIKGIGPQNEKRLNRIGVKRFEDVAKWTKKEQAEIGERLEFRGRIERENWVKQAKILARKATRI